LQYVYLLESITAPDRRYVGITNDLRRRLCDHNAGRSRHTAKFTPWRIVTYVAFVDGLRAADFEQYLKSGAGHAFALKRLW
jgi:putative endonuclease